jgi:hypothetical protein
VTNAGAFVSFRARRNAMFWLEQEFDSFDVGGWWSWLSALCDFDTVIWGN